MVEHTAERLIHTILDQLAMSYEIWGLKQDLGITHRNVIDSSNRV